MPSPSQSSRFNHPDYIRLVGYKCKNKNKDTIGTLRRIPGYGYYAPGNGGAERGKGGFIKNRECPIVEEVILDLI